MWLVGFALSTGPRPARALDLGTGSGVVAALLAAHGVPTLGLDARPEWGELWARTLRESRTAAALELRLADVAHGVDGRYDLVVANPPYFAVGTGPVAPDPWKRAARTESSATLADFVRVGVGALADGGRLCVVVPREREDEVRADGLAVTRRVRVGRRRTLVCLAEGLLAAPEAVGERDELVLDWVRRATHPIDPARREP
jgi:tRNA1(Val) A37 N6-methylase TrmN6